jgi:hypothetical protein
LGILYNDVQQLNQFEIKLPGFHGQPSSFVTSTGKTAPKVNRRKLTSALAVDGATIIKMEKEAKEKEQKLEDKKHVKLTKAEGKGKGLATAKVSDCL